MFSLEVATIIALSSLLIGVLIGVALVRPRR
jgi:ABC-type spermidine/putrescine transport system permease subunit II